MKLTGRTAMVTGGSGDIGGAICRALATAGANVAVSYTANVDAAEATAADVEALDRASITVQLDQRDANSVEAAAAEVADHFGGCDILVNCGAWNIGIPFPDLDTLDDATWDRVLETNLRGPYLLARSLSECLKASGSGSIVNIASVGGLSPGSSSIAYSCSKAGLIHLTHCLAVAMAPDVRVNCVAPGLVEGTRMALRLPEEIAQGARDAAVLGRVGSSEDIANATVMFCQADSVTGQTLVVDGGMPTAMNFG